MSFFAADKDGFWLYNEPDMSSGYYQLTRINRQGEVLQKEFHVQTNAQTHEYNWVSSHVFQKTDSALYFSPSYSNYIYREKAGQWQSDLSLAFGEKTFPSHKSINDYDITDDDFPYMLREHFYAFERYSVIDYFAGNERHFAFLDKKQETVYAGKVKNDMISRYDRFFPVCSTGDCLIEVVEAIYVKSDFAGLSALNSALENISEEDNPVLVLYSMKK